MTRFLKIKSNLIPILFIIIVSLIFFYKFFLYRFIPFPGDLLVGAYYPWLDYKWNNLTTNVPIKNPLISDVFSQFVLWKQIIIDSFKNFQWPLWNPYSYSGYPLLANFHSGALNPFNFLMLIFPKDIGWGLLVFSQFLFSSLFMFFFLRRIYSSKIASIIGSITYGFNGFMITWSQFATAGFALVWLPLIFLNIHLFFQNQKIRHLFYLSPLFFLLMTSGHFQSLIFCCLFSGAYFLWYLFKSQTNKSKSIIFFILAVVIGLSLMSLQIIPTLEMAKQSIRFEENYISGYNYGLLSLDRFVTLFAPDYFGNPVTYNFWGSYNYHESVIYCGIISIFAIIFCLFKFKSLKDEKFFLVSTVLILLLTFNTPLGKLIYFLNIPGLSTSSASRIVILLTFSVSILSAYFIKNLARVKLQDWIRFYWGYFLFLIIITGTTFLIYRFSLNDLSISTHYKTALRNLILPCFISTIIFIILILFKDFNLKKTLLLLILIFDLFRFGWKYLPFTDHSYFFPDTDITNFIQQQSGLFRIEKERDALMPSNTWINYHLSSSSGYDPMALNQYSLFYDQFLNQSGQPIATRYSEIDKYDAMSLGEVNVKYLLALKRDSNELKISPNGELVNSKISLNDWRKIFQYGSVVVLENQKIKPRIEIENDFGSVSNISYTPNKITFNTDTSKESDLIIRDTWYPGWIAKINDQETPINKYNNIYRKINVPSGKNFVEFIYHPKSFYYSLYISLASLGIWLFLIVKYRDKHI